MEDREDVLEDVLGENLKVVFCGTAPGTQSMEKKAYYAGDGNKFWCVLSLVGLTSNRVLRPKEYLEVRRYRIGLTDLVKKTSGADKTIKQSDIDRERLENTIIKYRPFALAFTSKKAGEFFLRQKRSCGLQPDTIGRTRIYILPSTSGLANGYWDEGPWQSLANDVLSV